MGVDVRVVQWLRERGHDAIHLRDEALHRMPDPGIFRKAIAEQRIILTFDLDFGEIAALSEGQEASVVLFRLHNTRTTHVIERLATALKHCTDALLKGAVIVVEESRERVRHLPVGRASDDRS